MDGFLTQVAADLYGRYGDGISSLHVMFPNRRAGLFFGEALSAIIDRPLWQPSPVSIDDLAGELSGLVAGERLRLVTELYKVYARYHPAESFDGFYFWGELLLGDFDSIDKYLIDADTLFSNLVDLHELDERFDYLSEEQRAVVTKFWGSFRRDGSASAQQRDFLTVWRTLAPVYHSFRERLRESGIATQGMVYREAAERILQGRAPQIPRRHYVIAGFNALSKCEQVIFDYLQTNFEVDFYWDYDNYFLNDGMQEAGRFMRDNLRRFPAARPLFGGHDNFVKPKNIRSVAAASDVLQCKYAGMRLASLARNREGSPGKETALVLCDESLLSPLLWSMPPEVDSVNVTMGYPLRMHPAYTFFERLVELQNRRRTGRSSLAFYHSDVEGLLRHPYLSGNAGAGSHKSQYIYINAARLHTSPLFEKIFSAPGGDGEGGWRAMSDYLVDVISETARGFGAGIDGGAASNADSAGDDTNAGTAAKNGIAGAVPIFAIIVEHIRTLANSLEGCDIELLPKTYASLLRRSLQSVTVPFEGEPLAGVQIMGILETRALDFENVILLSTGDSNAPGNLTGAPSFIPYNLKMAYGLPTPEHHEGVWAYHFFRLIQRAKNIEMVWSSSVDERSAGEPSRYILQLDYESPHAVEKESVTVDVNLSPAEPVVVEKTAAVMEKLGEFLVPEGPSDPLRPSGPLRKMSPSLFFSYVECPLKFYFRAVAGLREDDEPSEEVDNAMFGNILHLAMHKLYAPLAGVPRPQKQIRALIGSAAVEAAVTEAVTELYTMEERAAPEDWGGSITLVHKTIIDYIDHNILPFDASRQDFTIERLEEWLSAEIAIGREIDAPDDESGDEPGGSSDGEPAGESEGNGSGGEFGMEPEREPGGGGQRICFHGKADRIDRLADGTLRVVDYKTGSPKTPGRDNERFAGIEALFAGRPDERIPAVLQTLLYAMMLRKGEEGLRGDGVPADSAAAAGNHETAGDEAAGRPTGRGTADGEATATAAIKVQPALYYIKNLSKEGYSPLIVDTGRSGDGGIRSVEDYADYSGEFESRLSDALAGMFDPGVPFVQCPDPTPCAWCDFAAICRRS